MRLRSCGRIAARCRGREPAFDTAAPDETRAAALRNAVVGDERRERERLADLRGQRLLRPRPSTTGGLLARTFGLLVPAPSAPVSDAFTTSSTM